MMKFSNKTGTKADFDGHWQMLRKYQPNGPLVNAEFYPGWFTHWHDRIPGSRDAQQVADSLRSDAGKKSVCILF